MDYLAAQSEALPMPPPLPPAAEILEPDDYPVEEYHRALMEAAFHYKRCLARIAFYGWKMRLADGWTRFGYESGPRGEEAYRDSLHIPRSTWYKHIRIGQLLHQLSLEDIERIPTTNAELLTQVDAALIHDFPWIQEAKTLQPAQLAERVAERNRTVGSDKEPLTTISYRVPFLAKRSIEEMVDGFMDKHELSSRGQALELLIADRNNDASLLSVVHQVKELLRGVKEGMGRKKLKDSDEYTWLSLAKEILDEGYAKAVQAARAQSDGGQEGGRA